MAEKAAGSQERRLSERSRANDNAAAEGARVDPLPNGDLLITAPNQGQQIRLHADADGFAIAEITELDEPHGGRPAVVATAPCDLAMPKSNESISEHINSLVHEVIDSFAESDLTVDEQAALTARLLDEALPRGDALLTTDQVRLLGRLGTQSLRLERDRQLLDTTAREARLAGLSWRAIGRAVGITPQTAHQRWSADGNAKKRRRRSKVRAVGTD